MSIPISLPIKQAGAKPLVSRGVGVGLANFTGILGRREATATDKACDGVGARFTAATVTTLRRVACGDRGRTDPFFFFWDPRGPRNPKCGISPLRFCSPTTCEVETAPPRAETVILFRSPVTGGPAAPAESRRVGKPRDRSSLGRHFGIEPFGRPTAARRGSTQRDLVRFSCVNSDCGSSHGN